MTKLEDDLDARLAAARERKAARRDVDDRAAKARELAIHELEETLIEETGGAAGEAFTIIDAGPDGPFAFNSSSTPGVKVIYKRFMADKARNEKDRGGDGITPELCEQFVTPLLIWPKDKETFLAVNSRVPALATRAANAVMTIMQGRKAEEDSKR